MLAVATTRLLLFSQSTSTWAPGPILPADLSQIDDVAFVGGSNHLVVTGLRPDALGDGAQDGVVVDCGASCRETLVAPHDSAFRVAVSPQFTRDGTYVVYSPHHVYVTRDRGATIAPSTVTTASQVVLVLAPDFATSGRIMAAGYSLDGAQQAHPVMSASTDSGRSFATLSATGLPDPYTVSALASLPGGRLLAALSGPDVSGLFGLRCSSDGGASWRLAC